MKQAWRCNMRGLLAAGLALSLSACGGGGAATIGGTLTGLGSGLSLVLQNNNSDNLSLNTNASFLFATSVPSDSPYSVSVLTQPIGQSCVVSNGVGVVDSLGSNISSVAVSCSYSASVGGVLSGLAAGAAVTLTLSNNGNVYSTALAANGQFALAGGVLPAGTSYAVSVSTQPVTQTCTVSNGSGTVVAGTLASITVSCV